MHRLLPLILWLIVSMGAGGIAALSQITGLDIQQDTYDFQKGHTMIRAWGNSKIGLTWQVLVRWELGRPKYVLFFEPETEL